MPRRAYYDVYLSNELEAIGIKNSLLSFPWAYKIFQSLVCKFGLSRLYLYSHYLPYAPGMKVLDLGCGPGNATSFFDPSDYLGIDIDPAYIAFAKAKFPEYRFTVANFEEWSVSCETPASYDLIFAMGLFHHLDELTAQTFFVNAFRLLKPNGWMVCFDGCHYKGQSLIAKSITASDRGNFIREISDMQKLSESAGFSPRLIVENNVYLIPYSLLIMSLKKSAF